LLILFLIARPLSSRCSVPVFIIVASLGFAVLSLLVLHWSSGDPGFMFRRNGDTYDRKGLGHHQVPAITGSNQYIKHLPKLHQKVVGREMQANDIIHYVKNTNQSLMIVGKPGFGKSTLAIYTGEKLKEYGLDVFWVDIDQHFSDWTSIREIKSFYSIIYYWSDLLKKRTILILDDFDKLLLTDEKIRIFQETFLNEMATHSGTLSLIITTQIKTLNKNFHVIQADEINRTSSMELLTLSTPVMNLTAKQTNSIAEIVEDCPFALEIVAQILDSILSNRSIANPIEYVIKRLNDSKAEQNVVEKEGWKKYTYVMDIAFEHLGIPAQCCGRCISVYSGSFSEKLLHLMRASIGVPCNGSNFQDCVHKLGQNSMLDLYTLEDDTRYKMHTLIKRYFSSVESNHDCGEGYRQMFSLYFSTYCALPEHFNAKDLAQSTRVLALDYYHFKKLLQYIKITGSRNKYEAAVLMIAYQRGEIRGVGDYQLLYEAVCQCEDCVHYIISTIGNEAFGKIVMNVSAKIHDLNFLRCEFITDNFCSKALLDNPPGNYSTLKTMYNSEVIIIACSCRQMNYYHGFGTLGILGTLPLLLVLKKLKIVPLEVEIDTITVVFVYMNFLPGVVKLYFGSEIETIFLQFYNSGEGDVWLYLLFSQLLYEFFIMWFAGHFFQQREVLYAASIKIKNIVMATLCMCLPVAILQADLLGMYTINAVKWNAVVILVLLGARRYIFDYVTKKISNGMLLRLFFRLTLGILSATSEFSCRFLLFETSLLVQNVFIVGSVFYVIIIARFTALMFSYLNVL
jgi:cellulose biosynthesis protein BcsQ